MLSTVEQEAKEALVAAGITGPHKSHSRHNAITNIRALVAGDPDKLFGMSAPTDYTPSDVLGFLSELTGCSPDIADTQGSDTLDPELTVRAIVAAAQRLAEFAAQGAKLCIVTGHPTGMLEHNIHIARAYGAAGGTVVPLAENRRFSLGPGRAEVRYTAGVGCYADGASLVHTHSADCMVAMLEVGPYPDLVFGDHGFAGAAIERGIPAIAVMDINDPALAVAHAENRDVSVIPMDDNRLPRSYRPSWELFVRALHGG
ncbi:MAG: phosphatase [Actinobacteria bacterium]|nr:phosphatase [Actinomycetota bacterium]